MSMRDIIPGTRRDRKVNYGDNAKTAGGLVTLFHLDLEQATPLLITIQCTDFLAGPSVTPGDFRPIALISWGHGGSDTTTQIDCTYRQRFAVVGSMVKVQVGIGSFVFPGQVPPAPPVPASSHANFRGFVGEGLDGLRPFATQWVTQLNQATGVIAAGQQRLASLRAFKPTGNGVEYLLVFDKATAPAGGDVPMDAMPLPTTNNVTGGLVPLPMGETRGFVQGISWGMSSNPFAFAATGTAIFLSAELEQ